MNKSELQAILATENFNPRAYSLDEENRDEALCLRFADGQWYVYYSERGLQTGKSAFIDESSACEFFLTEMRSDPTTKLDWKSGFSI